jgi:hypothetical protein
MTIIEREKGYSISSSSFLKFVSEWKETTIMNAHKLALALSLALIVTLTSGCLTGKIQGQVIDNYDRPVVGAIVSTDPPTESVRTTENGYELQNVPIGEYRVQVRKPGYDPATVEVHVQWSQTTGADIQIERKE